MGNPLKNYIKYYSNGFKKYTKSIVVIAFPILIQFISQYILHATDTAFIGHYSKDGWSAIQNAISPYFMLLLFFLALTQGTAIMVAQSTGANKPENSKIYAETSFFFSQIISILYFLFWFFAGKYVLLIIGARGNILQGGHSYLKVLSFVYLTYGFGLTSISIFQGLGKTYPIMIISVFRSVLNVFLNWIFIFGKFGFPELGIAGAALGTVLSETLGSIILFIWLYNEKSILITFKGIFNPKIQFYKKILFVGIPNGLELLLWSAGQTILIFLLNKVNEYYSGFFGVLFLLMEFSVHVYMGAGAASLTLTGRAVGAKKPKTAFLTCNINLFYTFCICIIIAAVYSFFPGTVLSVFTSDKTVAKQLIPYLIILAIIIFPKGLNVVGGNSLRGGGDTAWLMFTQLFGTIFMIVLSPIMLFVFKAGIMGVLYLILIDELFRAIINYIRIIYQYLIKPKKLTFAQFFMSKKN